MKRSALWVALLILIGWSAWQFSQPELAPQVYAPLKIPDISKVAAIELAPASRAPVHLKKEGEKWMLAGKPDVPANEESVRHLLNNLANMRVVRVVTHTHAHDDTLGMKYGTKLTLLDQTDTALFTLTVGKQGSDLISTYVRIGQVPEVLAVDKSFVWQVRRNPNAWKAPPSKPHDTGEPAKKTGQDTKKRP
ncbi:MAG: DUF4340 domain-containing protein [Mariprofundaceae bacterium]|nr:DUF4340 domain-containing protein [Mariprofundaceae bacterium]